MEEHDGVRYSVRFCIEDGENSTFKCKDEEQLLTLFWMQHKRFDCVTIMDVKEKELHLFDKMTAHTCDFSHELAVPILLCRNNK